MTWLVEFMRKRPRLAQALGSLAAFTLVVGQMSAFQASQAQAFEDPDIEVLRSTPTPSPDKESLRSRSEEKTRPLSEALEIRFKDVKDRQAACKRLEGKILTYLDQTSYVRDCKQERINDPEALNHLVGVRRLEVVEVPARVFRLVPFGKDYEDGLRLGGKATAAECADLEGKYVSLSGDSYYWIKDCKKRRFPDFYSMQMHKKSQEPIQAVSPQLFSKIPEGPAMAEDKQSEMKVLYGLDSDITWRPLFRERKGAGDTLDDSPGQIRKDQKETSGESLDALCKKLDRRIVSFYSQIFFVDACRRRPVKEFTIEIQRYADETGGVLDLTSTQYGRLKAGPAIAREDLINKIR